MSNIQTSVNGFQVPPGMMLVPAPQQQIQPQPTVSQYKPPTITHSNSFKHNKVAPPPSAHKTNHALVNNCKESLSNRFVTLNVFFSLYHSIIHGIDESLSPIILSTATTERI